MVWAPSAAGGGAARVGVNILRAPGVVGRASSVDRARGSAGGAARESALRRARSTLLARPTLRKILTPYPGGDQQLTRRLLQEYYQPGDDDATVWSNDRG